MVLRTGSSRSCMEFYAMRVTASWHIRLCQVSEFVLYRYPIVLRDLNFEALVVAGYPGLDL